MTMIMRPFLQPTGKTYWKREKAKKQQVDQWTKACCKVGKVEKRQVEKAKITF